MIKETEMLKRKRALENRLLLRNITVLYADNDCPIVFIITKDMSASDVSSVLASEGFELSRTPENGVYASKGYWCELKRYACAENNNTSEGEKIWTRKPRENYRN